MDSIHSGIIAALLSVVLPFIAAAQTPGPSDAIESTVNGSINWTVGEVYAKGTGAPPSQAVNPAQARAMAERAAFVVAIRNLLETVKGVRVDSESVVENFMVKSDVIRTRVDGIVQGARVVRTQYLSDGSVEVLVGMSMKGAFLNAVVPDSFGRSTTPVPQPQGKPLQPSPAKPSTPGKKPEPARPAPVPPAPPLPEAKPEPAKPAPAPSEPKMPQVPQPAPNPPADATVAFKGGVATGLVIDGRGLGLRPALLPKIVDQKGQEVYVGQVVTRTNAVEQGVAGYAKDVNAAANNFRVTDNPAVIRGMQASGAARTDIVIAQLDADALRKLSAKGDFLQYCRVIIVY
ncbi:MAG TPA: hypothetical protein VL197_05070 [Nitrospirota bacterium]|nr:hypothetical protein [Nitrospirota bacterium]